MKVFVNPNWVLVDSARLTYFWGVYCASHAVPAHLQGYPMTLVLDYRFQGVLLPTFWKGWSGYYASAGPNAYTLPMAVAYCKHANGAQRQPC